MFNVLKILLISTLSKEFLEIILSFLLGQDRILISLTDFYILASLHWLDCNSQDQE